MMKKNLKVLLIDDDEPTNFFNKLVLEKTGWVQSVTVKDTGKDAIDFLKEQNEKKELRPDLILLDLNMPVMNGWEFLAAYKELNIDKTGTVVIVMLTTSMNPDDEDRAMAVNVIKGFKRKPLSTAKVEGILQEYFPQILTSI